MSALLLYSLVMAQLTQNEKTIGFLFQTFFLTSCTFIALLGWFLLYQTITIHKQLIPAEAKVLNWSRMGQPGTPYVMLDYEFKTTNGQTIVGQGRLDGITHYETNKPLDVKYYPKDPHYNVIEARPNETRFILSIFVVVTTLSFILWHPLVRHFSYEPDPERSSALSEQIKKSQLYSLYIGFVLFIVFILTQKEIVLLYSSGI